MDPAQSEGKPWGVGATHRGRGRGRGGERQRERGRRVPPEYLQRVIAERQGLSLNALPDGDEGDDKAERGSGEGDRHRELEGGDLAG